MLKKLSAGLSPAQASIVIAIAMLTIIGALALAYALKLSNARKMGGR